DLAASPSFARDDAAESQDGMRSHLLDALAPKAAARLDAELRAKAAPLSPPPPDLLGGAGQRRGPVRPSRSREGVEHGARLELDLHVLTPDNEALTEAFGGTIGLDSAGVSHAPVGLAVGYDLAVGFDSDKNVSLDARGGIGPGLRVGPVM